MRYKDKIGKKRGYRREKKRSGRLRYKDKTEREKKIG